MKNIKVAIYGAGAMGEALASCLLKADRGALTLISSPETSAALAEEGLIRTGIFGDYIAMPSQFVSSSTPSSITTGPFDFLLICTKTFDSKTVVESIVENRSRFLHDTTKIVLCHNGWGSADIFSNSFPKEQIFNARVITGFRRPKRNHVDVTVHADPIRMGNLFNPKASTELEWLAKSITLGDIPAEVAPDIGKHVWAKMLYNCALNPLGAVLSATYGALGDCAYSRNVMDRIIEEIFSVMKASGHNTFWETPVEYRKTFYEVMVPRTAAHESSMLQDIKAGRRTEIDFLSGAIVALGQNSGIKVPANEEALNLVRFLEQRGKGVSMKPCNCCTRSSAATNLQLSTRGYG